MDGQPGHFTRAAGHAYPVAATIPPGGRRRPRAAAPAFTLIEILIVVVILGILAAVVVPQFSNASHVARENTLKDDLRYLRTQIAVYKAQHRDMPPGFVHSARNGDGLPETFKSQLTSRTNANGEVGSDAKLFPFGPYLQKVPPNPLTQSSGVKMWTRGQKLPTDGAQLNANDQKQFGWIFRADTQEIIPYSTEKDARGRPYVQY